METIWDKYAKVLVDYSTEVKKGDIVQIRGTSIYAKDLVKAVYKRVLQLGGHPILRTSFEDFSDIFLKYASDEQLDYVDEMTKLEYEKVDKFISIGAPMNTKNLAKADIKKLARRGKATKPLSELLMKRSADGTASWVIADVPTHALAQEAKMSFDEYSEFLFKSCYLDLDNPVEKLQELDKKQTKWANYLNNVKKLHIIGEKTNITFNVEDGINGEIYFDFPQIYMGNEADGVHLCIENGKVVKAKADKGEDYLNAMFDMDEGSRGIGEIAIGTNEEIQDITGNILFDEKIGGAIHMAVGASYPETGGKNVSGLHWDLIKNMKNGGKIYADDALIYENGKFLI